MNKVYRYAQMLEHVNSRMAMAETAKALCAPTALAAWRAMLAKFGNQRPHILDTDAGDTNGGVRAMALNNVGVSHIQRDPRHKDAVVVVDSAIARLKQAMGKANDGHRC